jgi:hypothetical protein
MNVQRRDVTNDPVPTEACDAGTMKSRKRRRQQKRQQGGDRVDRCLNQIVDDGKENAANRGVLSRNADTDRDTLKEGSARLQDPFHDLLREMQSKDALRSIGEQEMQLKSQDQPVRMNPRRELVSSPSTSTPHPNVRSPLIMKNPPAKHAGFHASLPSEAPDQSHKPLSNQSAPTMLAKVQTCGPTTSDEFGDIDFSMEDLALIDSMVEQATQNNGDDGRNHGDSTVNGGLRDVTASSSQMTHQLAPTTDAFGDLPDVDFEALDKTIADQKRQQLISHGPLTGIRSSVESTHAPGFLRFTRYCVACVKDDAFNFVKTVSVRLWTAEMTGKGQTSGEASLHAMLQFLTPIAPTTTNNPEPIDGEVKLCGDWYFTPLAERDVIHICSLSGSYNTEVQVAQPLVLDTNRDDDLLLIVHPDMLLTPTAVSETVTCCRRAVLKNRLGSTGLSCK